jgi:CRP-like cAMP-binding protein
MKDVLRNFLSKFEELKNNEITELSNILNVISISKNITLVEIGQNCNLCYFVLKGCLRQYVNQDGIEKTIAIYTENQAINYYVGKGKSNKSVNNLKTIEDSILLVGNPEIDKEKFDKFPILIEITRNMIEADLLKAQNTFANFIISSPEQRYINLLQNRPDLMQRVPQHVIASYLGMTPESLSRIRKRIIEKQIKNY